MVIGHVEIDMKAGEGQRAAAVGFDRTGYARNGRQRLPSVGDFFHTDAADEAAPVKLAIRHQIAGKDAFPHIVMIAAHRGRGEKLRSAVSSITHCILTEIAERIAKRDFAAKWPVEREGRIAGRHADRRKLCSISEVDLALTVDLSALIILETGADAAFTAE